MVPPKRRHAPPEGRLETLCSQNGQILHFGRGRGAEMPTGHGARDGQSHTRKSCPAPNANSPSFRKHSKLKISDLLLVGGGQTRALLLWLGPRKSRTPVGAASARLLFFIVNTI